MPTKNPIQDHSFLFTGTLTEFTRAEAEALVEANGGKVVSGVSSKLNYLVVGADAGSKLDKAKAITTVNIITEKEFLKRVPKAKTDNGTNKSKKKVVNVFERMNKKEFEKQWSQNWMDYSSYTRVLLVITSDEDIDKEIHAFVEERP